MKTIFLKFKFNVNEMAWGFWKKIKNAFQKAATWVKEKVVQPVVNTVKKIVTSEPVKKVTGAVLNLAPAIGTAIGGAKGNPAVGAQVGTAVQGVGRAIGLG